MLKFMVELVHAGSAESAPALTEDVKEYLIDNREKLEAGVEEKVPTTGRLGRELDSERAREWMFYNRSRIWAMFYGSMEAPAADRR